MKVSCIAGVELACRDLERTADFYVKALGFTCESAGPQKVCLTLGPERLWLLRAAPGGRDIPADSQSNDRWFRHIAIVVRDMAQAFRRLMIHSPILISAAPQTLPDWNDKSAGIKALYFRDPEGHPLELLQFPPDKGKPRWHGAGTDLFQGIDHTAIVVASAPASIDFYRREADIKAVAEVNNYGEEQEHLTRVAAASMHVVSLAADRGIGLELLHYVQPNTGRPMPRDTCPDDIWWSRTVMQSGAKIELPPLHDPDGHETIFR